MSFVKNVSLLTILCFVSFGVEAQAGTKYSLPEGLDTKKVNNYEENKPITRIPQQYKGELKLKNRKEKFSFYTLRPYLGLTFNFSQLEDTGVDIIRASNARKEDEYTFKFDPSVGYSASFGLYSPTGLRGEIEYSQVSYKIDKFCLASTGECTEGYKNSDSDVSKLKVQTLMFNIILEKGGYNAKIMPYIGAGIGVMSTDLDTSGRQNYLSDDNLLAGQLMAGLSYKFGNAGYAFLGYRYKQSEEPRSEDHESSAVYVYETAEPYVVQSIDLGMRFMF